MDVDEEAVRPAADGQGVPVGPLSVQEPALVRQGTRGLRQSRLQRIRFGSQRLLIMAKELIVILVRVLLLTWMIIAYFMIRSMDLKNRADVNRKELTMDIIRFFMAILACFIFSILLAVLS